VGDGHCIARDSDRIISRQPAFDFGFFTNGKVMPLDSEPLDLLSQETMPSLSIHGINKISARAPGNRRLNQQDFEIIPMPEPVDLAALLFNRAIRTKENAWKPERGRPVCSQIRQDIC